MLTQSQPLVKSPFFGPAYVSRSTNLADQLCINIYPEVVETKTGKEIGALYGCPGLDLIVTVGAGPIQAMHVMAGTAYVVSGGVLYSVSSTLGVLTVTNLGTLGGPGGYRYSLPGSVAGAGFAPIVLPFTPSTQATFVTMEDNGLDLGIFVGMVLTEQDGFGLVNQPGTDNFFQSNFLDFSTWQALNFGQANDPDPIITLKSHRREIVVVKAFTTEFWSNAGVANFTFQREQGIYLQVGCADAPLTLARSGETLLWLSRTREGRGIVVQLNQYQANRISTHSIERMIQAWPKLSDAVAYSYQQEGHQFYVLVSPSGDQTLVYDITSSLLAGAPMWHQRGAWSTVDGQFHRHWSNCSVSFLGLNLVGDYRNGNIYSFDLNTFSDNGTIRRWLRTWRALSDRSGRPVRFSSLQIDMETGSELTGSGLNPQVMLRWSDDGGHKWGPMSTVSAGAIGQTAARVKFNRLGSTRRKSVNDRIFELSGSDPFPVALVGALLD